MWVMGWTALLVSARDRVAATGRRAATVETAIRRDGTVSAHVGLAWARAGLIVHPEVITICAARSRGGNSLAPPAAAQLQVVL